MIKSRVRQALFLAIGIAVAPGALPAQQAGAAPEVQGWLTEIQQLHTRLEALQRKALEDPQISAQQQTLGTTIKAAMEKLDPSLEQTLERMPQLEAQAAEAERGGDQAKLQQLGLEVQQIERRFMTAQQKALEQPDLAARVLDFQEKLQSKMLEVDPEAPKLISRFQELETKLAAAMRAPGQ